MSEPVITLASVPRVSPMFRFQWEEAQSCHVLLYPEGMVKLSGSAGEILQLVNGKSTVGELIAALKEKFPGASLDNDVLNFLEAAYGHGWLRSVDD